MPYLSVRCNVGNESSDYRYVTAQAFDGTHPIQGRLIWTVFNSSTPSKVGIVSNPANTTIIRQDSTYFFTTYRNGGAHECITAEDGIVRVAMRCTASNVYRYLHFFAPGGVHKMISVHYN